MGRPCLTAVRGTQNVSCRADYGAGASVREVHPPEGQGVHRGERLPSRLGDGNGATHRQQNKQNENSVRRHEHFSSLLAVHVDSETLSPQQNIYLNCPIKNGR